MKPIQWILDQFFDGERRALREMLVRSDHYAEREYQHARELEDRLGRLEAQAVNEHAPDAKKREEGV